MPETSAWVCNTTGKLFLTQAEYVEHLRVLARERLTRRQIAQQRADLDCVIDKFRNTVRSVRDIERWMIANVAMLSDAGTHRYFRRLKTTPILTSVRLNVGYGGHCRNTHSNPVGRTRNWEQKLEKGPLGYPGFTGRISMRHENWIETDLFKLVGIHTGTGGGNGDLREYEVTLWAEDFPKLSRF